MTESPNNLLGVCPDVRDRVVGDANELVQRWNHWSKLSMRSDRENYIDGNIQLSFEYMPSPSLRLPQRDECRNGQRDLPNYIPVAIANVHNVDKSGEVRDLGADGIPSKPCVICHWDGKPMLVESVKLVDQVEEFVPSRFTMGLQVDKRLEEACGNPLGQSILYGFLKPCSGFTKRELNVPLFPGTIGKWRDYLPISVVERGSEIVHDIGSDVGCFCYDGFVLFGSRGAVAGLCICFNNIREGSFFTEEFIKLVDVFRGPLDFREGAITHAQAPQPRRSDALADAENPAKASRRNESAQG